MIKDRLRLDEWILYSLAKRWPSPIANRNKKFEAQPNTEAYEMAYAHNQFITILQSGLNIDVTGLDVLEIGCGRGGIACFIACVGANFVTGIDLSSEALKYAHKYAKKTSERFGSQCSLPVDFQLMDARKLGFEDNSFDVIIADNVFEHFSDTNEILSECKRVLKPGGILLCQHFSSIYSKYGLHLKHGLKIPWANVFFRETVIIRVMIRLAEDNPDLYEIYPGLKGNPKFIKELRKYKDLNSFTFNDFKKLFCQSGLIQESFQIHPTPIGRFIARIPFLKGSIFMDIFSKSASALLLKKTSKKIS